MQAKHADICSGVFDLNCVYAPSARAVPAISAWKIPIRGGKRGQLKLPKSHER